VSVAGIGVRYQPPGKVVSMKAALLEELGKIIVREMEMPACGEREAVQGEDAGRHRP
jgi:hypothetical protein